MNERIKELIVESNNGLMRDGKCYPHIGSRDLGDWQRFAELIVRECIDIVPWMYEAKIKQHFGVES